VRGAVSRSDGEGGLRNLTGRQRYRTFLGKVILQVEWSYYRDVNLGRGGIDSERVTEWRDATADDLIGAALPAAQAQGAA